jgi:hypothetical protein
LRQAAVDRCARTQTQVLANQGYALDDVGRHEVQTVLKRDIPTLTPVALASPNDLARAAVLDAIEGATYHGLELPLPAEDACDRGSFIKRVLCSDGFGIVLDSLHKSTKAQRILYCSSRNDPLSTLLWKNTVEYRVCDGITQYPVSIEETEHLASDPEDPHRHPRAERDAAN